jgi:hypothetical protein
MGDGVVLEAEQVDVRGARGRADRELGVLGAVLGGLQHRPVAAQLIGDRQRVMDLGLGMVAEQDQRVVGEESVETAGCIDELGEAAVGLPDRRHRRLGAVAMRVVVIVR